ncbi:hypothetical protein K5X82_05065 [Halosquirtibacter xylanolyticus]|uniref:tetratricopeptide repeat protein n=1 Tax=Halosquirtibacter xylanolyticus TaxID=3374599 RepID=UPI0037486424|nr:hypothetical protein K5X82_05065 [Prolixibacteraceae bacterium]
MIRKFLEKRIQKKLKEGWLCYGQDRRERAVSIAQKYIDHPNASIVQDALRLHGLANYKLKRFDLAIASLERLSTLTNYKQDHYSLAISLLNAGEVDRSMQCFEQIASAHNPQMAFSLSYGEMILQFGKRLYQLNHYEASVVMLNQLMAFYSGVRTIDPEILYTRGIPSFHYFEDWVKNLIPQHHSDPQGWWFRAQRCLPKEAQAILEVYFI